MSLTADRGDEQRAESCPVRLHMKAGGIQSSFEMERKGAESPTINRQKN